MNKIISRGAESVIIQENDSVVKDRIKKSYRIKEIDEKLRKQRTKSEAKILEKLSLMDFPVPSLLDTDEKQRIWMDKIDGKRVRDALTSKNLSFICLELGKRIRQLHDLGIIHGDLTTSNFIYTKDQKIFFIDFGLSFYSHKAEDKAVDLHLLRQALESKHYKIWKKAFDLVLKAYNDEEVLNRLEKVEARGRNKGK